MLVVDTKDIEKLHKALSKMSPQGLPHAAKDGLNDSAFHTRRLWKEEGHRTMTVRNRWTFGGRHHRVVKARATRRIEQMVAITGNKLRYMAEQEHGVHRFALARKGVPKPTLKSRISMSKSRLVRTVFWRRKMNLGPSFDPKHPRFTPMTGSSSRRGGGKSRKKRYIAASIRAAKAEGKHLVYLDLGTTRGIYDVKTKTKTKKVWDLSKRHRYTKPNPMLQRTLHRLTPMFPQIHKKALENQIRFHLKKRGVRVSTATSIITRILR